MATYYADFDLTTGGNTGADWTNAWKTMADAIAGTNGTAPAAGDTVYCRGTDTLTANVTNTINGDETSGLVKWVGVNASGTNDGTRTVLDCNAGSFVALTQTGSYNLYENFRFTGSGSTAGMDGGGGDNVFINCAFDNNGSYGLNSFYMNTCWFVRCTFHSNSNDGLYAGKATPRLIFCSFHDNGISGADLIYASYATVVGCMAYDNTSDGYKDGYYSVLFFNSISDGNGNDGVRLRSTTNHVSCVIGCRITNHSGASDIGLNCNTEIVLHGWNYFENNDGNNIQNNTLVYAVSNDGAATDIEDQSDTNQGYTDLTDGSEDFSLASDATLRRTAITIPVT